MDGRWGAAGRTRQRRRGAARGAIGDSSLPRLAARGLVGAQATEDLPGQVPVVIGETARGADDLVIVGAAGAARGVVGVLVGGEAQPARAVGRLQIGANRGREHTHVPLAQDAQIVTQLRLEPAPLGGDLHQRDTQQHQAGIAMCANLAPDRSQRADRAERRVISPRRDHHPISRSERQPGHRPQPRRAIQDDQAIIRRETPQRLSERTDRLTTVYRLDDGSGELYPWAIEQVPFTERPALIEGGVGLLSTVMDYLRFSQMFLNGGTLDGVRVLEPETVALMTRNHVPDAVMPLSRSGYMAGSGWGLGFNVVLDASRYSFPVGVGEYWWDGSSGTRFSIDPEHGLITVIMAAVSPSRGGGFREEFKDLVYRAIVDER